MKMRINENEEIELLYSFRSNIYFEQITGHSVDFSKLTANDLVTLFYTIFISTLQKNKKPIVSLLEFLDIVDLNNGERCILEFSEWYTKTITAQYEILESSEDKKEESPIKTGKKK